MSLCIATSVRSKRGLEAPVEPVDENRQKNAPVEKVVYERRRDVYDIHANPSTEDTTGIFGIYAY